MSTAIHAPIGELTIAFAAQQRETLLTMLAEDPPDLLLDLGQIEACDSSGVQLLVALQRSARERGRHLRITDASAPVKQALATYALSERLLGDEGVSA